MPVVGAAGVIQEAQPPNEPDPFDMFSRDSSLSRHSYASAANYNHYNDQEAHIGKYIKKHPLMELLESRKWNNIPLPLKEMFYMLSDAMVGQDIHTWERKSLINERFIKQQSKSLKLHKR